MTLPRRTSTGTPGTYGRLGRRLLWPAVLLAAASLACERRGGAGGGGADTAAVAASVPSSPEPATADSQPAQGGAQPFARPVVVFMLASTAEIDSAHARMPDDEFYVMADDLSWYRNSAFEYLEKRHIPVVQVTGRQPLRFVVADTVRSYDFAEEETLDLLVVFDGVHPPRPLAPVDVQAADTMLAAGKRP